MSGLFPQAKNTTDSQTHSPLTLGGGRQGGERVKILMYYLPSNSFSPAPLFPPRPESGSGRLVPRPQQRASDSR